MAKFDVLADFSKSKGSFLYDAKSGKNYLDLFNMFSSVPIGYGHGIFDDRFKKEILEIILLKPSTKSSKILHCKITPIDTIPILEPWA